MPGPLVIGWKERAAFPDWNVSRVRVKIDTGARTSAIDAVVREIVENADGTRHVILGLRLFRRRPDRLKFVKAPLVRLTRVRNTGTDYLKRLVIAATIQIGPVVRQIELTVADRRRMLVPIILGRRALDGEFLVDASRKYVLEQPAP